MLMNKCIKKLFLMASIGLILTGASCFGMWDGTKKFLHANTLNVFNINITPNAIQSDITKYDKLFSEDPESFWDQHGKDLPFYLRAQYIKKIVNKCNEQASRTIVFDQHGSWRANIFDVVFRGIVSSIRQIETLKKQQWYIKSKINLFDFLNIDEQYRQGTITANHIKEYNDEILKTCLAYPSFETTRIRKLFADVLKKQHDEHKKGNCGLVHGRHPGWEYLADIYKYSYNLTQPLDKQIGNDYTFLRFGNSNIDDSNASDPFIWTNAALFGNAGNPSSCTAAFVLDGNDYSGKQAQLRLSPKSFFKQFNLLPYYVKYAVEFKELERKHKQSNILLTGNILLFSIQQKDLHRIRNVFGRIPLTESFKTGTVKNISEYVLDMDKDYALDPYNGPRIYSFNAADPEKFKEYEIARDQLFAKIRADIEADKKQQAGQL